MQDGAVDDYIARQPDAWQPLLQAARTLVLRCGGEAITESIKYGVPFYSYQGVLCYLSPGKQYGGIYIGFTQGSRMSNAHGLLVGDHLKQIRHYAIRTLADVQHAELPFMLQEAMLLNEQERPFAALSRAVHAKRKAARAKQGPKKKR